MNLELERYPGELKELRQAIEQAEKQGPVAFRNINTGDFCTGGFLRKDWAKWQPLYAAPVTCQENRQVAPPPQREWVWLSDQDYEEIMKEKTYWYEVPKAVEIKSKEKNT